MSLTDYYANEAKFPKVFRPKKEAKPLTAKPAEKGPEAKARHQKKLQQTRTKREMRENVLALDGERCRWPDCPCHGELEVAHFKAEGAGGDPMLNRYVPENLITLCAGRHRTGPRALHTGLSRMQPLNPALGMRGEVQFFERERTEVGRWYLVGVTAPPRKVE